MRVNRSSTSLTVITSQHMSPPDQQGSGGDGDVTLDDAVEAGEERARILGIESSGTRA
jgi:hypothetical protein